MSDPKREPLVKRKHESLEEFAKRMPPGHVASIPPENLTKEEYAEIFLGRNPTQRMLTLMKAPTDREAVVVGTSMIETELKRLLQAAGYETVSADGRRTDFSRMVDQAEDLGLISKEDASGLRIIGKIRGSFGHDPDLLLLAHDPVVGYVRSLRFKTEENTPPGLSLRDRFGFKALGLIEILRRAGAEAEARRSPKSPEAAPLG